MRKLIIIAGLVVGIYYFVNYMFSSGKFNEILDTRLNSEYAVVIEYYLGKYHLIFGHWDGAFYRFGRIIRNYPDSRYVPPAAYLIGKTYEDKGAIVDAITSYEKVVASYPESECVGKAEKRIAMLKLRRQQF